MLKLFVFLIINFSALGIGGLLIGNPSTNEWYQNAKIAPWTPPGWVFGFAWTTIMILLSFFMFRISNKFTFTELKPFYIVFALQWIFNIIWNPFFFRFHMVLTALVIIILLTIIVGWLMYWGFKNAGYTGILITPYFIWLLIATSLNAYIYLNN